MSALISPSPLQQICEAGVAVWLTEWSGLVGQVSARLATHQIRSTSSNREPQTSFLSLPQQFKTDISALPIPRCTCLMEDQTTLKEVGWQDCIINKHSKSNRCRKKARKGEKSIAVQYDNDISSSHTKCDEARLSEYLGLDKHTKFSPLQLRHDSVNHSRMENSNYMSSQPSFTERFDKEIIVNNVRHCSNFFRYYLPPVLIDHIVDLAWKQLSRLVSLGSCLESVQMYQVEDWVRRSPVLLLLASKVSGRKFPLNISGIPDNLVEDVLNVVCHYFPLGILSTFALPKTNFKKSQNDFSNICKDIYKSILLRTSLTSVILNCELCDDSILSTLSQLSLKELEIGGNLVSEKGIVSGLCALPVETVSEVTEIIRSGNLQSYPQSPLRKSLQKLDMSFQGLSNFVHHIIPAIFSELLYYNPHRNMVQCIQNFARLTQVNNDNSESYVPQNTLNILKINMGYSSRDQLTEIARLCPRLQEVSLIIDLDSEETLPALEKFSQISNLEITYYPSFSSSPPKLDARVLLPVIIKFKSQLRSLSLSGFSMPGNVFYELSQLPELYQLSLADCWISNPRSMPINPFPSLQKLNLKFLPPYSTMQLLTMGSGVQNLQLDLKGSEWEGSALTDDNIKYLVTAGIMKSVQAFTASSSYLTLTSLKTLAVLPCLKVIGYLASWRLTEEELRCVNHSGPHHILCLQ